MQACNEVDVHKDVLSHKNTLALFQCLRWNKGFPSLFSSIEKINPEHWNYIFKKVDTTFLDDKTKREEFLKHFYDLDKKSGLDDLGKIFQALSASNFFDGSYRLLECADNPKSVECLKQRKYVLAKKEIKYLLGQVIPDQKGIKDLNITLTLLYEKIMPFSEELVDNMRGLIKSFDFQKGRELFLNEAFNTLGNSDIQKIIKIAKRVLLSSTRSSKEPFLYEWPYRYASSADLFKSFILMDKYSKTDISLDFQVINQLLEKKEFECSGEREGRSFKLKLKEVFDEYMTAIRLGDRDDYLRESVEKAVLIQLTSGSCPLLASSKFKVKRVYKGLFVDTTHEFNMLQFIDIMNDLIGDHFEISKYLMTILHKEGEDDLFKILSHPSVVSGIHLLKKSNEISPELLNILYKFLLQINSDEYFHLVSWLDKINPDVAPLLSKGWKFFNKRERNFLFNVIDQHFDPSIDLKRLLDFYLNLIQANSNDISSLLDYYFSNKNMDKTLNAFKELSGSFRGEENLDDFRRFFSREHILEVLRVLTNGVPKELKLKKIKREKLGLEKDLYDSMLTTLEGYNLDLAFRGSRLGNKTLLKCLKNISSDKIDFYEFTDKFTLYCQNIDKSNFLFKVVDWFGSISEDYNLRKGPRNSIFSADTDRIFRYPNGRRVGLFDEKGLLSPKLFQTWLSLLSSLEKKYGLNQILGDFKTFLFKDEPELIVKLEGIMELLSEVDSANPGFEEHRNRLFRELSSTENFSRIRGFFRNLTALMKRYGEWVGSEEYHRLINPPEEKLDPRFECESFLVNDHGHKPCMDKETAKVEIKELIELILTKKGKGSITAMDFLIQGLSPDHKIMIPVNGEEGEPYHFSMKDVSKAFFNLSDPNLEINRREYPIIPPDTYNANKYYKSYKKNRLDKIPKDYFKKFTSIERVEHILRNLGFDNYNLLVNLSNGTAWSKMSREKLTKDLGVLDLCATFRYCGRFLNTNERIRAFNALMVSDVFFDVEEYEKFKCGHTIAAIVSSAVVSSDQEAQKVRMIYLNKYLENHNAKLLWKMGHLSVGSHIARFIHDRLGRSRGEFEAFIERDDFKLLNKYFLKDFPLEATQFAFRELTKTLITPDKSDRLLLNILIDKISSLSYPDLRTVENTLANLLSVSGYLGPLSGIPELKNLYDLKYEKLYVGNNIFPMLSASTNLLEYWSVVYDYWPENIKGMKLIKNINAFLKFIKTNLSRGDRVTYELLNDLFVVVNKVLFNEVDGKKGIDFIIPLLNNERSISQLMSFLEYGIGVFQRLNYDGNLLTGRRFIEIADKINFIVENKVIDLSNFREYLKLTTYKKICFDAAETECILNYHYDEPFSVIKYLIYERESGEKNLSVVMKTLLVEEFQALTNFSKKILSKIIVRIRDE